jgi:uroporphyrinogen-III decarboxylase
MTSRERILKALKREKPDMVPSTIMDPQPQFSEKYLEGRNQLETLIYFSLDPICFFSDLYVQPTFLDVLTYGMEIGKKKVVRELSPQWVETEEVVEDHGDWRLLRQRVDTPVGHLERFAKAVHETVWIKTCFIKSEKDIELFSYAPDPAANGKAIREEAATYRKKGISRGYVTNPWQDIMTGIRDIHQLLIDCYDRPGWVRELMEKLLKRKLHWIDTLPAGCVDLMEIGGGPSGTSLISPKIYEQFLMDADRRTAEALKNRGIFTVNHNCGKMMDVFELMVSTGVDAMETLTPSSHGGDCDDPDFVKKTWGSRVCLMGGFDQSLIELSTPEKIRDEVKRLMDHYGPGGGFILENTDHFFDAPLENVFAYAHAAREFGVYS